MATRQKNLSSQKSREKPALPSDLQVVALRLRRRAGRAPRGCSEHWEQALAQWIRVREAVSCEGFVSFCKLASATARLASQSQQQALLERPACAGREAMAR